MSKPDGVSNLAEKLESADDDFGIVIRGHLLIDYALDELLESSCKRGREIRWEQFRPSFALKVDLLYYLGSIDSDQRATLLQVNALRNAATHKRSFSVDVDSVKKLFRLAHTDPLEADLAAIGDEAYLKHNLRSLLSDLAIAIIDRSEDLDR